jgi:hypothetical protein
MIGKALKLLKENPVIILAYIVYMALCSAILFTLMPGKYDQTDIVEMLLATARILAMSFIAGAVGLVFISGFGHMLAEAVTAGRTSIKSFLPGIKVFFVRLLLAVLLLIAIYIGFSIVLSIAYVPLMLILSLNNPGNMATPGSPGIIVLTSGLYLAVLASIPFIILWLPAIFIDNIKVIAAFKKGIKSGTKNYGILFLWTLILYLPTFIYMVGNMSSIASGITFSIGYAANLILTAVISLIYLPAVFILYNEKRLPGGMIK